MYRNLNMDRTGAAKFLQVSERTLHNWESGRHEVPFAVVKLLRLMNRMDLPGPSWAGWFFVGGKLVSPEGHAFVGTDSSWWGLLVRRAAMFAPLYARLTALERERSTLAKLERALGWAAAAASARGPACGDTTAPVAPLEPSPMGITGRTGSTPRSGPKMGPQRGQADATAIDTPPSNTGVNTAGGAKMGPGGRHGQ